MASLLIAFVVLAVSFSVSLNVAASKGAKLESALNVRSGDPSVLEGVSFHVWSKDDYHVFDYNTLEKFIIKRNSVSFDGNGQANILSYARTYVGEFARTKTLTCTS